MTRAELGKLFALMGAAYPRVQAELPQNPAALQAMLAVWQELLGDLAYDVAQAATLRVLAAATFPGLPPVGLIRQAAAALTAPRDPDPDEAWAQVMAAMRRHGYLDPYAAYDEMAPRVAEVARGIGWRSLCEGTPDVVRGQFRAAYSAARDRTRQAAALPPALQDGTLAPADPPALAAPAAGQPPIDLGWVRSQNPERVGRREGES